jgi:hypothetical protein
MTTRPPGAHQPPPEAIQEALRDMLASRTAWDEPPQFGLIYRTPDGQVELKQVLVPDAAWRVQRAPDVLEFIGRSLHNPTTGQQRALVREVRAVAARHENLCGAYLRTEGWAPPPEMAEEIFRRDAAGGSYPSFSTLPGRVEVRMASAVDSAGRGFLAMQERGSDQVLSTFDGEGGQLSQKATGNVPKALRTIVTALTPPDGS